MLGLVAGNVLELTPLMPKHVLKPVSMATLQRCLGIPALSGIYVITCQPINRHYIGQTTDTARRVLEHWAALAQGQHTNTGLQAAWVHFGPQAFSFALLERLPSRYDEMLYSAAEHRWLETYRQQSSVFNVRPAGTDGWLRRSEVGRKAVQDARRVREARGQGNFHRRNKDHL